jgi:phosphoglycerol transferase
VALPLAAASGLYNNKVYLAQLETSWAPEKAGRFAHTYVPAAEHNRIAVVAETTQDVMRTQFQIDAPDVAPIELPKGKPIERYLIPARVNWLLVAGKNPLPEGMTPVAATEDYALVKLAADFRLVGSARLSEPYGKGIVSGAEGLADAEPWGRWSNAKHVVLHFSQPLPKHARIGFKARAFNVNATLPYTMRVGNEEKPFRVTEYEQELSLEFTTDGAQRSLDIEVPHPVSPHELGLSVDVRKLGIGLAAVEVYDTGPR